MIEMYYAQIELLLSLKVLSYLFGIYSIVFSSVDAARKSLSGSGGNRGGAASFLLMVFWRECLLPSLSMSAPPNTFTV